MFPSGCPAEPKNERPNQMAKRSNAASAPRAGKMNETARGKRTANREGFGNGACEIPKETFPKLKRDGVRVAFYHGRDRHGNCAGWCMAVSNPIADALAAADRALAVALDDDDTAALWDDLIPTRRRGAECALHVGCDAATVRAFIGQARRNGFKVVADDPAETKGGAE